METKTEPTIVEPGAPVLPTANPIRILFLDVDGVTCTQRAHYVIGMPKGDHTWNAWDAIACEAIKLACAKDVRIVVSSTWRHDRHQPELFAKLDQFNMRHLLFNGEWKTPDFNRREISVSGSITRDAIRGDEIADWLSRHPECRSYRILDDNNDMLPEQMPYLIHTDLDDGMSANNIRQLLRWSGYLKS